MSCGKVVFPVMSANAVSSGATAAGLTGGGAFGGLATVATATGIAFAAVGAAATAVVLSRVAMGGLHDFGQGIMSGSEDWKQKQAASEQWQKAILDIVDRNARIAQLRAAWKRADGEDPDLPGPLSPSGMTVDVLRTWCERIDRDLERSEQRLAERIESAGLSWLSRNADPEVVSAAQALAEREVHRPPAAGPDPAEVRPPAGPGFASTVKRIIGRLPADLSPEEYASVVEAAAKATSVGNSAAARTWVSETRRRAEHATAQAAARREDVQNATRYLAALRLDEVSPDLFPPEKLVAYASVVEALQQVADGTARLTPDLRRAAEDAQLQAQGVADSALMIHSLGASLKELDYEVRPGPPGLFELKGRGWGDHSVHIAWADGDFVAELQRNGLVTTDVNPLILQQWRGDFGRLAEKSALAGVPLTLVSIEPEEAAFPKTTAQAARETEA